MRSCNAGPSLAFETSQGAIQRHRAVRWGLCPTFAFAATLAAGATPVSAAALETTSIRADFDNDGIPDTVTVVHDGASSQVRVWLSHRARFRVLRVPDEVVAVVAADVNADGRVDVRASTRRYGVLVWLNLGRGHLSRVRPALPTLAAKHRFGGTGPSASPSFARLIGDDNPPSGSLPDLQRTPLHDARIPRAAAGSPGILSADDFLNAPPRAPPTT
jgi:hypothetical protein